MTETVLDDMVLTTERPQPDMVNSPPHYIGEGGIEAIDVIDVIERYELGYHLGSAAAYILRAGKKGSATEDVRKADWYLKRWVDRFDAELSDEPLLDMETTVDWLAPEAVGEVFGLDDHLSAAIADILGSMVFTGDDISAGDMVEDAIEHLNLWLEEQDGPAS